MCEGDNERDFVAPFGHGDRNRSSDSDSHASFVSTLTGQSGESNVRRFCSVKTRSFWDDGMGRQISLDVPPVVGCENPRDLLWKMVDPHDFPSRQDLYDPNYPGRIYNSGYGRGPVQFEENQMINDAVVPSGAARSNLNVYSNYPRNLAQPSHKFNTEDMIRPSQKPRVPAAQEHCPRWSAEFVPGPGHSEGRQTRPFPHDIGGTQPIHETKSPLTLLICQTITKNGTQQTPLVPEMFVNSLRQRFKVTPLVLASTTEFTRWLFEQKRGDITPWAIALVGWREAKPCAMAISALISSNVNGLRPDKKRPPLPDICGTKNSGDGVATAVKRMVILEPNPETRKRANEWVSSFGNAAIPDVSIQVVGEITEKVLFCDSEPKSTNLVSL